MTTLEQLNEKWEKVLPGANVFGGGIWNPSNDLNWAMQQIRPTGKPAGDRPEYNEKAAEQLSRFIPSLSPEQAGELVKEIHTLTHQYIDELTVLYEGDGLSRHDATIKARGEAFGLSKYHTT